MGALLVRVDRMLLPLAKAYQEVTRGTDPVNEDDRQAREFSQTMLDTWAQGLAEASHRTQMRRPQLVFADIDLSRQVRFSIVDALAPGAESSPSVLVITRDVVQLVREYETRVRAGCATGHDVGAPQLLAAMILKVWDDASRQTAGLAHLHDPQLESVTLGRDGQLLHCSFSDAPWRAALERELQALRS